MATIDDQRLVLEVDAAGTTVLQAHHAVRVARLNHCRHGRTRPVNRGRRVRRPHVSQYRPADPDGTVEPLTMRTVIQRRRRPGLMVVTVTFGLSVLCVGFIRVVEPDAKNMALLLGVYVIAAGAAVCLNAFTLDAMAPPADVRNGPNRQCSTTGARRGFRDSGPDNSKEQR